MIDLPMEITAWFGGAASCQGLLGHAAEGTTGGKWQAMRRRWEEARELGSCQSYRGRSSSAALDPPRAPAVGQRGRGWSRGRRRGTPRPDLMKRVATTSLERGGLLPFVRCQGSSPPGVARGMLDLLRQRKEERARVGR
jgi:hypothetical protein